MTSAHGGGDSASAAFPLVTVFVACYNHARFVVQALASVRAQNYPNVQLIVTDDCSKDDSVAVIRDWLQRHWPDALLITHSENRGICRTFNEVLAQAKGKYISGFAADDVWLPDRLGPQVAWMETQPEEVGVIYSDAYQIDENGRRLPEMFIAAHRPMPAMPEGWIFGTLAEMNFIPAMTTLVRRRCFETVGGYDESLAFEDWDMWLRIARQFRFHFWPHITAEYRVLSTSLMRTQSHAIHRSGERILLKCLERGWLTGPVRAVALSLDHAHAAERYRQKSPDRFRAAWACWRRRPGPQNLLLLLCCLSGTPAAWHDALRGRIKNIRHRLRFAAS